MDLGSSLEEHHRILVSYSCWVHGEAASFERRLGFTFHGVDDESELNFSMLGTPHGRPRYIETVLFPGIIHPDRERDTSA